jgi:hypothetical protein
MDLSNSALEWDGLAGFFASFGLWFGLRGMQKYLTAEGMGALNW